MTIAARKEYQHMGETPGCSDRDHDMIHELSKKLDALWRYDQYIANAEGYPEVQALWRDFKRQDQTDVTRLKALIAVEIKKGSF